MGHKPFGAFFYCGTLKRVSCTTYKHEIVKQDNAFFIYPAYQQCLVIFC